MQRKWKRIYTSRPEDFLDANSSKHSSNHPRPFPHDALQTRRPNTRGEHQKRVISLIAQRYDGQECSARFRGGWFSLSSSDQPDARIERDVDGAGRVRRGGATPMSEDDMVHVVAVLGVEGVTASRIIGKMWFQNANYGLLSIQHLQYGRSW